MYTNRHRKLLNTDAPQNPRCLPFPQDVIIPPTTTTTLKPIKPIASFDASMALTILVLLTALFFMGFFSVYLRRLSDESPIEISRRRRQQQQRRTSSILPGPTIGGVDPMIIQSLPSFSYDGKKQKEWMDCVVCLTEFEEKERVKMIPRCGHVFHPECIDKWLGSHGSCPLCRSTQLLLEKKMKEEERSTSTDVVRESSTVASVERERDVWAGSSMRRTSSWANLRDRVLLRRSLSF